MTMASLTPIAAATLGQKRMVVGGWKWAHWW